MEIELEELLELAREYEFNINIIRRYYEKIKDYPCVINGGDKELLINCLHLIIQDRISINFIISQYNPKMGITFEQFRQNEFKSLEDSISDALYRTYGEDSINNLSEQYRHAMRLTKTKKLL